MEDDEDFAIQGESATGVIFDGDGSNQFLVSSTNDVRIRSITIKEMSETNVDGAGIEISSGTGVIIEDVIFRLAVPQVIHTVGEVFLLMVLPRLLLKGVFSRKILQEQVLNLQ